MPTDNIISLILIGVVSLVLIVWPVRRGCFSGIPLALVIVGIATWARDQGLSSLGITKPDDWRTTIFISLVAGCSLALVKHKVIDPAVDRATGASLVSMEKSAIHSVVKLFREDKQVRFLVVLSAPIALISVFLSQELIFRGFLMLEFRQILGTSDTALILNVLAASALFGLTQWHVGKVQVFSNGIIGAFMALLFIWGGFNLWQPLLTDVVMLIVLLILIYHDAEMTRGADREATKHS